jgi:hypothetical protein
VAQRVLVTDLLRAWGRKDPRAACSAWVKSSASAAGRQVAFRDWLLRDPESVAQWMKSGDDVPEDLRKVWLSERLKTDPQDALRQLAELTPEAREAALLEWSTSLALRPAERESLLLATADHPALQRKCAVIIAGALADRSVGEAMAFVDGLGLDEEATTSLHDGVFVKWAARDPQAAFADWASRQENRVSSAHLRALDNWSLNSPGTEEAIRWLATIHPGPAKEMMQLHFINNLTGSERFEQAVRMGLSLDDRDEGKRQAMRAAAAWQEKVSQACARPSPGHIARGRHQTAVMKWGDQPGACNSQSQDAPHKQRLSAHSNRLLLPSWSGSAVGSLSFVRLLRWSRWIGSGRDVEEATEVDRLRGTDALVRTDLSGFTNRL